MKSAQPPQQVAVTEQVVESWWFSGHASSLNVSKTFFMCFTIKQTLEFLTDGIDSSSAAAFENVFVLCVCEQYLLTVDKSICGIGGD